MQRQQRYQILLQLINRLEEFDQEQGNTDNFHFNGFVGYLGEQAVDSPPPRKTAGELEKEVQQGGERLETSIATLIIYMYRYARLYGKKALQGSPLQSLDEFSYLVILLTHESMTKMELIRKNAHEKTTGMEIIKRLVKSGFMEQWDDETDKRSQRVRITDAGKGLLYSVFPQLDKVSDVVSGILSQTEKETLHRLLVKLDHFHYDIYLNNKDKTLNELAGMGGAG